MLQKRKFNWSYEFLNIFFVVFELGFFLECRYLEQCVLASSSILSSIQHLLQSRCSSSIAMRIES